MSVPFGIAYWQSHSGLLNLYTFGLTMPLLHLTVISVLYRINLLHGTKSCFSSTLTDSYIGMFPNVLPGIYEKRKHHRDREEPIKQALKEEYIYILLFCFHYIYIYLSYGSKPIHSKIDSFFSKTTPYTQTSGNKETCTSCRCVSKFYSVRLVVCFMRHFVCFWGETCKTLISLVADVSATSNGAGNKSGNRSVWPVWHMCHCG